MKRIILFSILAAAALAAVRKAAPAIQPTARETFAHSCASCHGRDGRGGGPSAAALANRPPDLTTLSLRNNGNFPYARVSGTIAGDTTRADIVQREMPCFGLIFRDNADGNPGTAQARVADLTEYIRSLQAK